MKSTFDLMRVWAALTGLVLAAFYFVSLGLGARPSDLLPMLIAAIGGFELSLYAQDLWLKRRRQHG
ncbi:hypothetical protein ACFOON_05655 [Novosphingobium piscinae]|uniref:Uncharacterized protein n=1 Tax=Novosphingobium piscinae TaxID=1507448 RepID=A0A7X1KQJ8_9SPHN|nr:hypothetical protein [Novosphingobium piscinae]MBC2669615.1 hypothetical protein [Novosphingobium piscinae]